MFERQRKWIPSLRVFFSKCLSILESQKAIESYPEKAETAHPETFFYRRKVFDLRSSASPHSRLPKSIKMLLSKISFQVHKIAIYHLNHDFYSILFEYWKGETHEMVWRHSRLWRWLEIWWHFQHTFLLPWNEKCLVD